MFRYIAFLAAFAAAALLTACGAGTPESGVSDAAPAHDAVVAASDAASEEPGPVTEPDDNPFFTPSELPYGMPPFDRIRAEHFGPALRRGMAEHLADIEAIIQDPAAPGFENTIVALERAGSLLNYAGRVFGNLSGAHTNPEMQAVQREMAPDLAAHMDAILLNPDLFRRVGAVYEQRHELDLDAESLRLVERYHSDFVRAGANLSPEAQDRLRVINGELAELGTAFSQNVLAEVNESAIVLETEEALEGLTHSQIGAAAEAAAERGIEGGYVLTLLNTSGQPPLAALVDRDVRRRLHEASLQRGSRGGDYDNREIFARAARLRAERAQLLGYEYFAEYALEEQTAGSVDAVNRLHADLAPAALANVRQEATDLQALIDETEDEPFELASWDWAYYSEKLRQARYEFDDAQVRDYFELENVLVRGVFFSAEKLFGIRFVERKDLPVYHPDVRVWEVFEEDGTPLGLFLGDFYARSSKRGGAWMNSYVLQSELLGGQPVVGNHLNIPKPPAGEPTLLTFDEVTTLFHEFGHGIHGLFSNVTYPRFSGTSVPRDFVEYPSQVYEMWAEWPEVLNNYALHHETGEPIPPELLQRLLDARLFNEGFRVTEYLAASILDQAWHQLTPDQVPDADGVLAFEARALAAADMDSAPVPPRYRTTYFSHIIGGYAAGYYSYIWSEVLDADSIQWFHENGGLTRENGEHFRATILSSGGSVDALALYEQFAGRQPDIRHLLVKRGLAENAE